MIDSYMKIDGIDGESSDEKHRDWIETVKAGEITLAQVAVRLGTNEGHLLSANPQIKDPHNLKVGQEIHLPTHPNPKSESSVATPPATVHATDLPKAPLGDPLVANMVKVSLLGEVGHHHAGTTDPTSPKAIRWKKPVRCGSPRHLGHEFRAPAECCEARLRGEHGCSRRCLQACRRRTEAGRQQTSFPVGFPRSPDRPETDRPKRAAGSWNTRGTGPAPGHNRHAESSRRNYGQNP